MRTTRTITDGQGLTPTGGMVTREQALGAYNVLLAKGLADYFERLEVAGSVRRGREMVHDLDIVGIPRVACTFAIAEFMRGLCTDLKSFRGGEKMVSAVVRSPSSSSPSSGTKDEGRGDEPTLREVQVDIYFATPENFGMLLTVRTGSAQHNVYMARMAKSIGLKFAAGSGVLAPHGEVLGARTEEEVFGAFGLTVPEPRLREIACGIPLWMK